MTLKTPPSRVGSPQESKAMNVHMEIVPVVSVVAGIVILIVPKILNYVVAAYLILIGVVGILHFH
jgi:hypothetical protein